MSAPSESAQVWHYDGEHGIRRSAALVPDGDGFVLVESDRETGPFAFADLIAQGGGQGHPQFGLRKRPGWRIGFVGDVPTAVAERLPGAKRYGGVIDRIGLWPAAVAFALVSAVGLYVLATTPAMIAKLIPRSVEARMGALMVGDFGERACVAPAGSAALAALARRLDMPEDVRLRVVDVPIVNAVALPGGQIVLFRGLIDDAASADEVAGVLGHELGHVENRDVLEALVRQLGFSVVLGGLDGNVGGYTNALLSAGYSREAESRADGFAIEALRRAGISPRGVADFFKRVSKQEVKVKGAGVLLGYLSSHPMSSERQARYAASAGKQAYTPALSPAQWQALRGICGQKAGK